MLEPTWPGTSFSCVILYQFFISQVCSLSAHNPMDSLRHASSLSNMHSNEPSTAVLTTAHPASTLSYTHWFQASIPSRTIVPMPTQNNHSGQDMQQRPVSHTSLWADWHTLRNCQIIGWQMQQNTCATVCWSTSCNIWHPQKDLGSCYCDTCPTTGQLSSMHQQWSHILLHAETPSWTQCQSGWHCSQWHNCHTTGSN